jgi:hypothetical protein
LLRRQRQLLATGSALCHSVQAWKKTVSKIEPRERFLFCEWRRLWFGAFRLVALKLLLLSFCRSPNRVARNANSRKLQSETCALQTRREKRNQTKAKTDGAHLLLLFESKRRWGSFLFHQRASFVLDSMPPRRQTR